jgi:hypothetical protein
VDVGFCQPKFCGHCALVGRAHPLLNVTSLTGSIGQPHISEELTGIRIHLTRIGFNPTRLRHDLAQIGVHLAFVRGQFAGVGIRLTSSAMTARSLASASRASARTLRVSAERARSRSSRLF